MTYAPTVWPPECRASHASAGGKPNGDIDWNAGAGGDSTISHPSRRDSHRSAHFINARVEAHRPPGAVGYAPGGARAVITRMCAEDFFQAFERDWLQGVTSFFRLWVQRSERRCHGAPRDAPVRARPSLLGRHLKPDSHLLTRWIRPLKS